MQDRLVSVLLNIKPTSMRGQPSTAMVLAASSPDGNTVELLDPPATSKIGEHITFTGYTPYTESAVLPRANEKVLKAVFEQMSINPDKQAAYQSTAIFTTTAGAVTVPSLPDKSPIK